jgi:uncharacterized protein YciI
VALFVYIGTDGPKAPALRKQHRPAHLAHLEPLDDAGRIRFAGPLLDESGTPQGSVVIFEAEGLASARTVAEGDPYLREGVFERQEVFETRAVFPRTASS